MLQVKAVTKNSEDFEAIKELFLTSFPEAERAPMGFLLWRAKREYIDFLAFYDEDTLVGFIYLVTRGSLTFVLHIAINSKIQSKGYGTQILNYVSEKYVGNRIILNIEELDENADNNDQRIKRRNFYIKNGYKASGMTMIDKVLVYEVLISGGDCTIDEYFALLKRYAGFLIFPFIKPKLTLR